MRGCCALLLNVLLCTSLSSQEIHFSFQHLTTDQGLATNEVNAILQDSSGYIWFGTSHGLQRYDGQRFLTFRHDPDNPRTIPSNMVRHLHIDRRNRLWLMSPGGLTGIFDTGKMTFRKIEIYRGENEIELLPEARFIGDEWGNVFIVDLHEGLFIWNEREKRFLACTFPPPAAENWRVVSLAPRPGTSEYVVSFGANGLYLFHTEEGNWQAGKRLLQPLSLPGFPHARDFYNAFVDRQDRLWFQSWPNNTPKVYCYRLADRRPLIQGYEPIELVGTYIETRPFFQSSDGAIWAYGYDVFARYDESLDTFQVVHNGYANSRSIQYRLVSTLFEDREQTIWVGTNDNGVFSFNPGKEFFHNVEHLNRRMNRRGHGSPMAFLELADSTILVSVWSDGLYRYDRQWNDLPVQFEGLPYSHDYSYWSLYRSQREGIVWLSSQPGRIVKYHEATGLAEPFRAAMLEDRTIRQVVEDRQGNLWLGMHGTGVFYWKVDGDGRLAEKDLSRFDALPKCLVAKMILDRQGLLWVATETAGLYAIDPVTRQVRLHLTSDAAAPEHRLAEKGVSSVLDYNDSLVVISGSSTLLAYNRNRGSLTRIPNEQAIAGYIADLALDRSGNVWVSTTSGLYRIDIFHSNTLRFGRRDGIDDENFVLASSRLLSDGRMLFGASETFLVFDPAVFDQLEQTTPEASITTLHVNNRLVLVDSVREAGALRLRSYESSLSIEFSTLQFYRRHSIRYKMEGLDQDWQVNENNIAVYSYLPAGAYDFLLQPIQPNGTLGAVSSFHITRSPPFWQAWWFYSLICLAGGWIIYLFDRERMRRRKSVQQMRTRIADNLHAEIKTALNSIHILSEMATIKARKDANRAANYLAQINTRSQQMMQSMDDILWTLAPENDSMSAIVNRIEEYVYKLRSSGLANIDLLVDREVSALSLDMRGRQLLLRLIKESISGLLRAGVHQAQVHLGKDKMQLSYVIEFEKAGTDLTVLNNLLQSREMFGLLSDMGATHQMDLHQTIGFLHVHIPL